MSKSDRDKLNLDEDLSNESVEELRNRLNAMKRLVAERQQTTNTTPDSTEFWSSTRQSSGIIDGNFLSIAFGLSLLTIICVSIYAFYNLYNAVLKKFPSSHTEL